MIKVLFICHGNICRSTMAEYVMKALVNKSGLSDTFSLTLRLQVARRSVIRFTTERVIS